MALEDLQTGRDLFDYVLNFGGQPGGANDEYAAHVKAAIREAYWDFLALHNWWFARAPRPLALSLQPAAQVTVSSISGQTVNLSGPISTSQAGKKFALQVNHIPYRITAHTAGTAVLTLDAEYAETETSGLAWVYQDELSTPADCRKIFGPFRSRTQWDQVVDIIPEREFEQTYWNNVVGNGRVEAARLVRGTIDGTTYDVSPVLQFAPYPDYKVVLEAEYLQFHNLDFSGNVATDSPRLPRPDRWVLAERALFVLWRNKNNTLADSAELRASRKQAEMERMHLTMTSKERMFVTRNNRVTVR